MGSEDCHCITLRDRENTADCRNSPVKQFTRKDDLLKPFSCCFFSSGGTPGIRRASSVLPRTQFVLDPRHLHSLGAAPLQEGSNFLVNEYLLTQRGAAPERSLQLHPPLP